MMRLPAAIGALLIPCLSVVLGCDATDDNACGSRIISTKLSSKFYWGGPDAKNWTANREPVRGSGTFVQWLGDHSLVMLSTVMSGGVKKQGITKIDLDSSDRVVSTSFHAFDYKVFDMKVGNTSNIYVMCYMNVASEFPRVVRLNINGADAIIDSVVLDESWQVRGIAPQPIKDTMVVCASLPGTTERSFLHLYPQDGVLQDSVLMSCCGCSRPIIATRAMDLSNTDVLFFADHFSDATRSLVLRRDLKDPTPDGGLVIYDGPTYVDYLAADPLDDQRVLVHANKYDPRYQSIGEDVIQLLDGRTFAATPVDVHTSTEECLITRNSFAEWKSDGSAFFFPAWSSDGKREFPSAIWRKTR